MIVLGFDTSSIICSVGVLNDGEQTALEFLDSSESHSIHLISMIDRALKRSRIQKDQIDLVAVGNGPGSFTGTRIAVTTAKTISYALQKPCIAVNTLDAMAYCIPCTQPFVCPVIDARKNEVYWRLYKCIDLKLCPETDLVLTNINEVFKICPQETSFCGSGVTVYYEQFKKTYMDKFNIISKEVLLKIGIQIARLGQMYHRDGIASDPSVIVPKYIRRPEAEVQWIKRNSSGKETCE
ncbi:MAG: tRNA (adenosine(37)-N6)-threonylcarbamoyltransferase complex dimerization subunit type 1 TsaB [Candidatus Schekmanbacteria bacterium RBG_13_48_7]|uniref:tRNA (Adenosine(37)-N6)-threonylcarbamoyltransferase complex dimerization subunit type 1 TsaB n=1 Tax=Candidatus Schekmanbacteria bacterium RBG_13_48_7 TaxID=1817878 RepID=A0A1F7S0C6_9BACT|nr:MAG: tRNA (adenosine(37)-N6)-threonylcarbamoyltransferase complex dimerization subunit type 1 TsaB [Candidatus Schekmanbacteria bacterium RBG_13_48_7]